MFFDGWNGLGRVLLTGIVAYPVLVVALRVAGKRTLAKLNAFDLVVTVALGSTLSAILTSADLPLLEGIVALLLLIGLQVAVAFTASRWGWVNRAVKAEPRLLVRDGQMLPESMRSERVTESDLRSALRRQGLTEMEQVREVVLEPSGDLSVVPRSRP